MTRKDFLQTLAGGVGVAAATDFGSAAPATSRIRRGVSLYSYQEEYYTRTMTLENCICEAADIGANGIEIISTGVVPNFPDPPERWVNYWLGLMEKYHTTPSCYDNFLETDLYKDRPLTDQELLDMVMDDVRLAHRMGFRVMRAPNHTPLDKIEKALPFAEKQDMKLTIEIHSPIPLNGEYVENALEFINRTKTKHFGFTVDMSLFVKRPIRVQSERAIRDGIPEKIVRYIDHARMEGVPKEKAQAEAEKMGYRDEDNGYGTYLTRVCETPMQNPDLLKPILPYLYHVHAKFWEMTDEMREYSVAYDEIIPILIESGYDGYLSSEYEGQRWIQDAYETNSREQVRRNQLMLRRLLHEI